MFVKSFFEFKSCVRKSEVTDEVKYLFSIRIILLFALLTIKTMSRLYQEAPEVHGQIQLDGGSEDGEEVRQHLPPPRRGLHDQTAEQEHQQHHSE